MPRKAKPSAIEKRAIGPRGKARPSTSEEFLSPRQDQDLLRLVVCGGVADGKSTLIERMLRKPPQPLEGETRASAAIAYSYFDTGKRKFIVADIPGQERYTGSILTGASSADAAVLLVDARRGITTQTRRNAYLLSLMGVRRLTLAVNKMDLLAFDPAVFNRIRDAFQAFARALDFQDIAAIPLSALRGDNVIRRSAHTPWHAGPTLTACLDAIKADPPVSAKLVFPIERVDPGGPPLRSFGGRVLEGRVNIGDEIRVTASGRSATVAQIFGADGPLPHAVAGDRVTLRTGEELDTARGDVLSLSQCPLDTTDQFEATLVWLNAEPGHIGRAYDIELATQLGSASITGIKHRVNIDTLAHEASRQLALGDISACTLATGKALAFDTHRNSRTLGGFILLDRFSHATVAAGMIRHSLRRAQNVHKQALSITRRDREKLNGHKGKVIWFTGLSGSGKSTIANALEVALHAQGRRTYLLDGDNVRQGMNKDLGFTDADRVENIRRIAEMAKLMMDAGLIVMTAFISPFMREREMARELIGPENFVEAYMSAALDVCERRDSKGLYKKARAGLLPNMSGIGSPYEPPPSPQIILDSTTDTRDCVTRLLELIAQADAAARPTSARLSAPD